MRLEADEQNSEISISALKNIKKANCLKPNAVTGVITLGKLK